MKNLFKNLSLILSCLFLGACAGYEPLSPSVNTSFSLSPIQNQSTASQVVIPLQRALRESFIRSGVYDSSSSNNLKIELIGYERKTVSLNSTDTGRPESFRVTLTAKLYWEGNSPSPFGEDPIFISAEKSSFVTPSLINSEYDITPELVEELASRITSRVVHSWEE